MGAAPPDLALESHSHPAKTPHSIPHQHAFSRPPCTALALLLPRAPPRGLQPPPPHALHARLPCRHLRLQTPPHPARLRRILPARRTSWPPHRLAPRGPRRAPTNRARGSDA